MRYLLLFTIALTVFSCSNARKDIVMKTPWKYDLEATRAILTGEPVSEAQVNFMEGVMNRLKDATVEFQKDNLLVINMGDDKTLGYWEISGDQILMQVTKQSTSPYDILEMTADRIVLKPDSDDQFSFVRVLVPAK